MDIPKHSVVRDLAGDVISPINLPPPGYSRWTPNKKAIVVRAVRAGLVTLQSVLDRYQMTEQEFSIWEHGLYDDGATGLKITKYQKRRRKGQRVLVKIKKKWVDLSVDPSTLLSPRDSSSNIAQ